MNEYFINFLIQAVIPLSLAMYAKAYKKSANDSEIPEKGGFRTKFSIENIENWKKVNYYAYKITKNVIITQIICIIISFIFQYLGYNSVKLYVITVSYMLISHFISVIYIQYMQNRI